jgi:hypothetical protein
VKSTLLKLKLPISRYKHIYVNVYKYFPTPVAARSKRWVCGHSIAGIAVSNYAGAQKPVSCECRVLSGRSLCNGLITRSEESHQVWRVCLWSRNLNNKGQFTHTMPFPCCAHAVPLPCRAKNGLDCVFPIWFTQCGRVWFAPAMPRPYHAVLKVTSQDHGTARHGHSMVCEIVSAVQRRLVGDLPAFGFFWLPWGVPRRLLSEAYQSVKL